MIKILFILIVILFCHGKIYAQYDFSIVQKESFLPIRIGADTTTNRVFNIGFPLVFEITNNTSDTLKFSTTSYLPDPYVVKNKGWRTSGMDYNYADKKIEYFKERDPARFFKGICTHTYVHTTGHSPSNDSLQQVVFAPYLQRMRAEKVTRLEIESIQELKAKNSKLLDLLLKGDSIRFTFRDRYSFYNEIIPVEVK